MLAKLLSPPAFRAALLALVLVLGSVGSSEAGTLVTFNTNMGAIQVDMYTAVTPATTQNFINYINSGLYSNSIIHRAPSNFVVQGGGFDTSLQTKGPLNASIDLEYRMINQRGTIAMARSTASNSATSQWFINSVDNTTTLAPRVDNPATPQNEFSAGYAVFGWVVSGMNVVDAIAALPLGDLDPGPFNQTFDTVPLKDYTSGTVTAAHLVTINSVTVTEQHPSFQNPIWDVDANNSGNLSTADVMVIVNSILTHGRRFSADASRITDTYKYFDANGDNFVSTSDLMMIVNAILRGDTAPAAPLAAMADPMAAMADPMAAPLAVVPEPSSLALGVLAATTLGILGVRRRRAVWRSAAKAA